MTDQSLHPAPLFVKPHQANAPGKETSDTRVEMTKLVDSSMTNIFGHVFGGIIMSWMDACACMSAEKFSGHSSVTAAMDDLNFLNPIKVGDAVVLKSQVNRSFNSSMEVGVKVVSEDLLNGKIKNACSAYFTFVSTDKDGNKLTLQPILPDNEENSRRFTEAAERRAIRFSRREKIRTVVDSRRETFSNTEMNLNQGKNASASRTLLTELVLPIHTNHMGTMFGGQAMAWMEHASFIAASRHARCPVVLSTVDDIHFFVPCKVGDRVIVKAQVTRTFDNILEVGSRLERTTLENPEITHCLRAYMTFSSINGEKILPVSPKTEDEIRRYEEALGRTRIRLERKTISQRETLSTLWTKENALYLIYSNIRGLMTVANRKVFEPSAWKSFPSPYKEICTYLQTQGNITCVRLEVMIQCPPESAYQAVMDLEKRSMWDVLIDKASIVQEIDGFNHIVHITFKNQSNTKSQDFCLLRSCRLTSGEYVISNRSVLHDLVPPIPDYTRSEVLSSGFIIREISNAEPVSTFLCYIVQLGAKALSLAVGDIVGDSTPILESLHNLKQLLERGSL